MNKRFTASLLAALLSYCPLVGADVYVIVSADSLWSDFTQKDVLSLYMGRGRSVASEDVATVYDLPKESPAREMFYASLTGMSPAQINSYWSRLIFTGKTLPPPSVPSEQAMLAQVRRNPRAIGYLSNPPADPAVRTLLVVKGP